MLGAISAIWAMPTAKASMCSTIAASQANSTCWMPSGTNQLPNPVKYMAKGGKSAARVANLPQSFFNYILQDVSAACSSNSQRAQAAASDPSEVRR